MVLKALARKYRPTSSEVVVSGNDPPYQDKWTKMLLSRRNSNSKQRRKRNSNKKKTKKQLELEEEHPPHDSPSIDAATASISADERSHQDDHDHLVTKKAMGQADQQKQQHVIFSMPLFSSSHRNSSIKKATDDLNNNLDKTKQGYDSLDDSSDDDQAMVVAKAEEDPVIVKEGGMMMMPATPVSEEEEEEEEEEAVVKKPNQKPDVVTEPVNDEEVEAEEDARQEVDRTETFSVEKTVEEKRVGPTPPPSPAPNRVVKPTAPDVGQEQEEEDVIVLKKQVRQEEEDAVVLKGQEGVVVGASNAAALRGRKKQPNHQVQKPTAIPQIATIGSLGPKLLGGKVKEAPNKRRRSKSELPDWWKRQQLEQQQAALQRKKKKIQQQQQKKQVLQAQRQRTAIAAIPQIATVAALAPKLMKCKLPESPNKRKRSKSELPDWWKQRIAEDLVRQQQYRRATWHVNQNNKSSSGGSTKAALMMNRRKSLLEKEVSAASLLSGVCSAPLPASRRPRYSCPEKAIATAFASGNDLTTSSGSSPCSSSSSLAQGQSVLLLPIAATAASTVPSACQTYTVSLLKGAIPKTIEEEDDENAVPELVAVPKKGDLDSVAVQQLVCIDEDVPMSFKPAPMEEAEAEEQQELEDEEMSSLDDDDVRTLTIVESDTLTVNGRSMIRLLCTIWPTIVGVIVLAMAVGMVDFTGLL